LEDASRTVTAVTNEALSECVVAGALADLNLLVDPVAGILAGLSSVVAAADQ
jgi:hypothetical protein